MAKKKNEWSDIVWENITKAFEAKASHFIIIKEASTTVLGALYSNLFGTTNYQCTWPKSDENCDQCKQRLRSEGFEIVKTYEITKDMAEGTLYDLVVN